MGEALALVNRMNRYVYRILLPLVIVAIVTVAFWPLPDVLPVKYIDRSTGEIKTEKIEGEAWMKWLYYNPVGELSLYALVKRKFVSEIYGNMMDKPSSSEKVPEFVKKYDIDLTVAEKQEFDSFNDFFTRKLKSDARSVAQDSDVVVSPADGKILVFDDISETDFFVKGYRFNVYDFLNDSSLSEKYRTGTLMIIRLAPPDYHRFHFPVNGTVSANVKIAGDYFSVSPIALRNMAEIFCMNKREYVTIATHEFGDVIMAEVGAAMVGSIIQTYQAVDAKKGTEKGFFKFGGSTVILLFEKNKIIIDKDLLKNSAKNLETTVKMGERIALRCRELSL